MFFLIITVVFLLILAAISFGVFLSSPNSKGASMELVFNKPKANIDMGIFDSDQFKRLQPFTEINTQYSYKALTKSRKQTSGFISAVSIDEAKANLESMGLTVTEIKEVEIGRTNPFIPYYPVAATTNSASAPKGRAK